MLASLFSPINAQNLPFESYEPRTIGSSCRFHIEEFPSLEGIQIAIIGVPEERFSAQNRGTAHGLMPVRRQLYKLYEPNKAIQMADLGDLILGDTAENTLHGLKMIIAELGQRNIVPIIIGGQMELSLGLYWGFEKLERLVDLVVVDATFDLLDRSRPLTERPFLNRVITHEPNYLFNLAILGYQRYLTDPDQIDVMQRLFFDTFRLGEIRASLQDVEPIIRSADMMSFSMRAIRAADAPGNKLATPNGFAGYEACQICRYAGFTDKLSAVGFFEYNAVEDTNFLTAQLLAQMIWHFLDGFGNRMREMPATESKHFVKYIATIQDGAHDLIFYKSRRTDRWWIEVPVFKHASNIEKVHLVPCSYKDYQAAMREELPDIWIRAHQKNMQTL